MLGALETKLGEGLRGCPPRALLEGPADCQAIRCFDAIAKDVVANAPVIATPSNDARPGERAPEGAAPQGLAPSCPGDDPRDDSCERAQETLKILSPSRPYQQVHVRTDVGKIVHAYPAPDDAG